MQSAIITSGNNIRTDIVLAFTNLPSNFAGMECIVQIDSAELNGTTEPVTAIASLSSATKLDATTISDGCVIPITSGHDLDWYNERNGTYQVSLTMSDVTKTYTLVINVPDQVFGFYENTISYETFDTAPFAVEDLTQFQRYQGLAYINNLDDINDDVFNVYGDQDVAVSANASQYIRYLEENTAQSDNTLYFESTNNVSYSAVKVEEDTIEKISNADSANSMTKLYVVAG